MGGYQCLFFCHMKPMLLLVSQRFFASNLQHRSKQEEWTGRSSVRAWRWAGGGWGGEAGRDKGVVPPSDFLLPPLGCPRRFLFCLSSHKVAAFDRLGNSNAQLLQKEAEKKRIIITISGWWRTHRQSSYAHNPTRSDELWWWRDSQRPIFSKTQIDFARLKSQTETLNRRKQRLQKRFWIIFTFYTCSLNIKVKGLRSRLQHRLSFFLPQIVFANLDERLLGNWYSSIFCPGGGLGMQKKGETFLFGTVSTAWTERERPRLQDTNGQIPEKMRALWSRIIPITPVAQPDGRQRQKSCLHCHSWDRFIISQATANFDQQLGTVSPKVLGSTVEWGGGVLR